jgi:hypothetical protein
MKIYNTIGPLLSFVYLMMPYELSRLQIEMFIDWTYKNDHAIKRRKGSRSLLRHYATFALNEREKLAKPLNQEGQSRSPDGGSGPRPTDSEAGVLTTRQ